MTMKISEPDRKVSEQMQALSSELDKKLEEVGGQRMSFSLIVFNSEPGSRVNYASNCDRDEVATAMVQLLANWQQGMPDIKTHEISG